MQKNPAARKNPILAIYDFITHILYDETWWFLRLATLIFVAFACAGIGYMLHKPTAIQEIFREAWRYMLAPLAAGIVAFLLGASYVEDIYELGSYRLAMRYMWASIYNGPSTGFPAGLGAGVISLLFFGSAVGLVLMKTYAEAGLVFGLGFGFLVGLIPAVVVFALFWFGLTPSRVISEGRQQDDDENDEMNLVSRIGGPGWLYVEPGNVVMVERLESPSDVLGAGIHYLNRFQRIKSVISLKDQHGSPRDVKAITKDGIFINVRDFQFRFRLDAGHRYSGLGKRTLDNPYPYSIKSAYNMTYSRSIGKDGTPVSWDKAVQFSVDGAITDYINQNLLDRILFPRISEGDPRSEISRDIEKKRVGLKTMYGSELIWYDFGNFEVDASINIESIKALNAEWTGKADIARAEGEAERIANEERGRAEAQLDMFNSIIEVLDDANLPNDVDENMWNIVLVRTAQIIESMTKV